MIIKLFFGCVVFLYGWMWLEQYRYAGLQDDRVPLMQKYDRSSLKNVLRRDRFESIADRMPKVAAFLISMDPVASRTAVDRWLVLILAGWIHFCFLSGWPRKFLKTVPRTQIFLAPIGLFLLFLLSKLGRTVIGYFSPGAAGYFWVFIKLILGVALVCIVAVSLLSIPVSIALLLFTLGKTTGKILALLGCRVWIFGEKVFGVPKEGRALKLSQYVSQKQTELKAKKEGATLPGPIVRRVKIDGVEYDR